MMNGLQSVPTWVDYFNDPQGSQLGLLNAIQVCINKSPSFSRGV